MSHLQKHNRFATLVIAASVVVACGGAVVEPVSQQTERVPTDGQSEALAAAEYSAAAPGVSARWNALADRNLAKVPVSPQGGGDGSHHFAEWNRLDSLNPVGDGSDHVVEQNRFDALRPTSDGSWEEAEFRAMTNAGG